MYYINDGYNLYFMFAYACAVNDLLTYNNAIFFKEHFDLTEKNKLMTTDNELKPDLSFNTRNFPEYVEHSKFRQGNSRQLKKIRTVESKQNTLP